jgi:ABC-type uncharacterized transport system substrate-binding protein
MLNSRALAFAGSIAGCVLSFAADAHPHVFVDAKVDVVFDASGRVSAVRNIWQFDEAFSQFAIEGNDTNGDGDLSAGELQSLAKINVESLEEYGFFTHLTIGDADAPLRPPTVYGLAFDGSRLTLSYTLPLSAPVAVNSETRLEVFDPQYFVAFAFSAQTPVTLVDAPEGCSAAHHEPGELDSSTMNVLSQIPMDQRSLPLDLAEATKSLANYVVFRCFGTIASTSDASAIPWPIEADGVTGARTETGAADTELLSSPLFLIPLAILAGGFFYFLARRPLRRR